ncbi:iron complex transport system substrate-binding protein [Alkalibacillus filiformis]|uniref:Iron complex transport system substrate-binding protein n=1 Tax=Alkalibacillus filiformis TaxID=200990 RepID=A0ABU0DP67_9BACI|nr:iron-siderophore ABC transporter substrate-binding protein [Alkalibacillus filiformis]MDQ0350217.1 iron complex transport system substrate-binding protein [Alkalibacillus filiformis]
MFKRTLLFLSILGLVLFLAACGSENSEPEEENGDTNEGTEETTDTEESAEIYEVEHAMGTTEIEGTPENIVVLTNHGTEALLSLGITPTGAVQSWVGDPWYDHIADDLEEVNVVGLENDISLESIAELEPDLILGNKMRQEEHYEALSAIAPTVFEETLRGDWKINFELIAEAVNKEEKGQEVLDNYQERIDRLSESLDDRLDTEVSLVRFMSGDVRIYYKDSFPGIILDEIGLARPEAQDVDDFAATGVTKERIDEMEGDVIFYFTYETGDGEGSGVEGEWTEDALWNNLEAVQEGNAYKVNDTIWNTAGGVKAANLMLDDLEDKLLSE